MEMWMVVPQKIKNRTTMWPIDSLLGVTWTKQKQIQKDMCTPMFTAALFSIAKVWKKSECSKMDKWTKKLCYL